MTIEIKALPEGLVRRDKYRTDPIETPSITVEEIIKILCEFRVVPIFVKPVDYIKSCKGMFGRPEGLLEYAGIRNHRILLDDKGWSNICQIDAWACPNIEEAAVLGQCALFSVRYEITPLFDARTIDGLVQFKGGCVYEYTTIHPRRRGLGDR